MDFTFTQEQEQLREILSSALRKDYSFTQRQAIVLPKTAGRQQYGSK